MADWLELSASEVNALLHVPPHPCIVQLYGISVKLQRGDIELVLVMEYLPTVRRSQSCLCTTLVPPARAARPVPHRPARPSPEKQGNSNMFVDGAGPGSPYSLEDRMLMCLTVAQGLEHLHSLSPPIIHRDLKPDNILTRPRPPTIGNWGSARYTAVITDFGLARLRTGQQASAGRSSGFGSKPFASRGTGAG